MKALVDRIAVFVLNQYPRSRWGLDVSITPFIVKNLGPIGALRWVINTGPKADRMRVEMGGLRANLMLAIASLLNGCSYCLYAHARAFELYYFDQHNKLFPLDQHGFLSLIPLTDDTSKARLEKALTDAGLSEEVALFRRVYALKLEGAEPTAGDEHLVNAIAMYDMLNYCAVDSQVELDDAHDGINRDVDLKARYAQARLEAGRGQVLVEDIVAVDQAARASGPDGPPSRAPAEKPGAEG